MDTLEPRASRFRRAVRSKPISGVSIWYTTPARHPGKSIGTGVAQNDDLPSGHVFAGIAFQVRAGAHASRRHVYRFRDFSAEHHGSPGKPDAGPCIGIALDDQHPLDRPVSEAFSHAAVDARAVLVEPLHHGNPAAVGTLPDSVLRAAFNQQVDLIADPGTKTRSRQSKRGQSAGVGGRSASPGPGFWPVLRRDASPGPASKAITSSW